MKKRTEGHRRAHKPQKEEKELPAPAPKILLASSAVSPLPPSGFLRTQAHVMVSDRYSFRREEIEQQLLESSDFFVVGVLGTAGAGKSTIMNHLAGPFGSLVCCLFGFNCPLTRCQTGEKVFKVRSSVKDDSALPAVCAVTAERLLLLDLSVC